MAWMAQELEGIEAEQIFPGTLGGGGLGLDGGEAVGERCGEKPRGSRGKASEGGGVGVEHQTDQETGGNPTEGAPDTERSELTARVGEAGKDDHTSQTPDGGGTELLYEEDR